MKIYPQQFVAAIEKRFAPSYLLLGDEPLLKIEALDLISKQAKKQGFDEVHRFEISTGFKWERLFELCQSYSLFSSRMQIELTLPESGVKKEISDGLLKFAPFLHADIVLVVLGGKIAPNQEKSPWFSALKRDGNGVYLVCNTPTMEQFPQFVIQRCQQMNLKADPLTIQSLAELHEGNLLALKQSLQLLSLMYPDGHLSLPRVEEVLNQQSHFTPFQLVDAVLLGNLARAQKILMQLEQSAEEPIVLLRIIQKELFTLYKIKEQILLNSDGQSMSQRLTQNGIWSQKQFAAIQALERLSMDKFKLIISQIARLELGLKTELPTQPWHELSYLCFLIATS